MGGLATRQQQKRNEMRIANVKKRLTIGDITPVSVFKNGEELDLQKVASNNLPMISEIQKGYLYQNRNGAILRLKKPYEEESMKTNQAFYRFHKLFSKSIRVKYRTHRNIVVLEFETNRERDLYFEMLINNREVSKLNQ